jgi:hypothetical protein
MATFSGSLAITEIKRENSPFTASFGDIITNTPWKRPTTTKVDSFQTEWFASNDISSFDIWLLGSYRESLERTIDWAMWDVDYVINGDLNSDLVNLLESALTIGFKYELWVDALHWNIPPLDYTTYDGTKTAVNVTKPYKRFHKEMNDNYYEANSDDAVQMNGLNLYQTQAEFPSSKQLTRTDNWYQNAPLKVNSTTSTT